MTQMNETRLLAIVETYGPSQTAGPRRNVPPRWPYISRPDARRWRAR